MFCDSLSLTTALRGRYIIVPLCWMRKSRLEITGCGQTRIAHRGDAWPRTGGAPAGQAPGVLPTAPPERCLPQALHSRPLFKWVANFPHHCVKEKKRSIFRKHITCSVGNYRSNQRQLSPGDICSRSFPFCRSSAPWGLPATSPVGRPPSPRLLAPAPLTGWLPALQVCRFHRQSWR